MVFVDVGDVTLNVEEAGSGDAIVLIHGLAGDSSAWRPQINALSRTNRVVAFDNRGAGKSTQREEAVSTLTMAIDTLRLMDKLGISRAHVMGRSMGGAIAQHMALLEPERIGSLVLCASFARLDPVGFRVLTNMREVLEWRNGWGDHARHSVANFLSARYYNDHPNEVNRIVQLIGSETRLPACYVAQNHACLVHDTLSELHRIQCPTLVMGGTNDPICSPTTTSWLVDGIPNATCVMFEDASHFFLMEKPSQFMKEVLAWYQRQPPL